MTLAKQKMPPERFSLKLLSFHETPSEFSTIWGQKCRQSEKEFSRMEPDPSEKTFYNASHLSAASEKDIFRFTFSDLRPSKPENTWDRINQPKKPLRHFEILNLNPVCRWWFHHRVNWDFLEDRELLRCIGTISLFTSKQRETFVISKQATISRLNVLW
jgi:hypothetical protein